MEKEQVSFTALSTAFCRGYHAVHDTPKIFDDFLANSILTEYELTSIEQYFVNINFVT
jgi:O-methyltransferase involved in polyketide biosynthesis